MRTRQFTLMESMIALAILAISTTAILALLNMGSEMGDLLDRRNTAMQLATKHIEKLRDESFSVLPLFSEEAVLIDDQGRYNPDGTYRRTTSIVHADSASYMVSVTIASRGSFLRRGTAVDLSTVLVDYSKIR